MGTVFLPGTDWQGQLLEHIGSAFQKLGYQTQFEYYSQKQPLFYRLTRLNRIININARLLSDCHKKYNTRIINAAAEIKPQLLFTLSGGRLFPETVQDIRKRSGTVTATFVVDNPFDSSRDKYYAMGLQHYEYIFVAEKLWIDLIRKIAPKSKIYKMTVGYNPDIFTKVDLNTITENDISKFKCDVSFTGANYGQGAEGAYRAGILTNLGEFDLRIWGYGDWPFRFKYYPELARAYQGESLDWSDLRKLYTLSTVNLNLPSPQILTGIQPRIFDIAAVKGFQIIDDRQELWEYFTDEEIVTFKTIEELKEKITYFLRNPQKRTSFVDNLYAKVNKQFTWEKQIRQMLRFIN